MKRAEILSHLLVVFIADAVIIIGGTIIHIISGKRSDEMLTSFLTSNTPIWVILLSIFILFPIFGMFLKYWNGKKRYGFNIEYPKDGSKIKSPIEVVGSYNKVPAKNNIYLIEYNPEVNLYWPKNQIILNSKNKTWTSKLSIGGGDYKQRRLILAEVTDSGVAFINYYKLVSSPGSHRVIKDFHTVLIILDEVNLILEP